MARTRVDRGIFIDGVNKTIRDNRVPTSSPRVLRNFSVPDGRAKRRKGKSVYSGDRFRGSQLMKHGKFVPTTQRESIDNESSAYHITPMSYGLLKWHEDFQPITSRDWTIEFVLTLGDSESVLYLSRTRLSRNEYDEAPRFLRASELDSQNIGGVVFDMSVIANHFDTPDYSVDPTADPWASDPFSLSALTMSYTSRAFKLGFDVFDVGTFEYTQRLIVDTGFDYAPGRVVHVAVRFTTGSRRLELVLDGAMVGFYELGGEERFCGEGDAVNGGTYSLKRDIVLLNEFTVRGGMASSCAIHSEASHLTDAFEGVYAYDAFDAELYPYEPTTMCHSPPSGTGMAELRFWGSARTDAQLLENGLKRLSPDDDDNILAIFRLDDGGPVCSERLGGGTDRSPRLVTLHHGTPGYVSDPGLSGGFGLVMAEGQHLRKEYQRARLDLDDSYVSLSTALDHGSSFSAKDYQEQHDFTVLMEIRTPHDFGKEQNYREGQTEKPDAWGLLGTGTADQEEGPRYSMGHTPHALTDGDPFGGRSALLYRLGDSVGGVNTNFFRAFDQTLWSIEADSADASGESLSSRQAVTRFPVTRGLLTPEGRVAFEFYGDSEDEGDHFARQIRIVSRAVLQANQIYKVGFRKRTISKLDTTDDVYYNVGYKLEIFVSGPGVSLGTTELANNSIGIGGRDNGDPVDIPAANTGSSTLNSGTMPRGWLRDVLIGSSMVNDRTERSASAKAGTAQVFTPVTQRYITPWQDQPGYFTLGSFRMWTRAISDREVRSVMGGGETVPQQDLLYNLFIDRPVGESLVSRSKFNTIFSMGYKSWGQIISTQANSVTAKRAFLLNGWNFEDRIGYGPTTEPFFGDREARCEGLVPFASTLERRYGILTAFDGALFYDDKLDGAFRHIRSNNRGLLNDFATGGIWRGTSIADRTILVSRSGRPKVWDGTNLTTLGFPGFGGGAPLILALDPFGSATTVVSNKWYGFRVAYISESRAIIDFGPQQAVKSQTTASGQGYFQLADVSPHPDPRVTSMVVYMTRGDDALVTSRQTAEESVAIFANGNIVPNRYLKKWDIIHEPDGVTLDLERTPFPNCGIAEAAFNRLYLSGDPTIPDIIYYSESGNPESINVLTNRIVLEHGSGDEIIAMRSAFGVLWVFKPGSIWSVVDTGQVFGGVALHDISLVAPVGPTSADAIAMVTFPETGRVAFVFWSKNGPYIFDGINVQPIGFPVEGEDAYVDIDDASVIIVHDVKHRELAFLYRSLASCCSGACSGRPRNNALVYNYRTSAWSEETGVLGSVALSSDITVDVSSRAGGFSDSASGVTLATESRYLPLVGTENGRVLLWGQGDLDGVPSSVMRAAGIIEEWGEDDGHPALRHRVLVDDDPNDPPWVPGELRGLWVTVLASDKSDWFLSRIRDNTDTMIVLHENCQAGFTPDSGDFYFIGLPPAEVEFPWDDMDAPFLDKQVHRMTFWGKGEFIRRKSVNWDEKTTSPWESIPDSDGARKNIELRDGRCEVMKLHLASVTPGAEINSYMWHVTYMSDGNSNQR